MIVPHGGEPLATLTPDTQGRIVHLEDEPETIYAQLVAGAGPGMTRTHYSGDPGARPLLG
ncbi:MAG: hypothetical protein R3C44_19650 [Chloroflexota bacterium]